MVIFALYQYIFAIFNYCASINIKSATFSIGIYSSKKSLLRKCKLDISNEN